MEKVLVRKNSALKWKMGLALFFILMALIIFSGKGNFVGAINPVIRFFQNKVVTFQVRNYHRMETEHFVIRYEGIDEDVLDLVEKTAEYKFKQITKLFEYQPKKKILFILYDNPESMMKITTLGRGTPPMGVYYGDALHILDPNHWVEDRSQLEYIFYHEGPVLHELVHLLVDHLGKGNFPSWFTEGVSLYFEYHIDNYQWGKGVVFQEGDYTLKELTNSFHELDQYLAYTKSFRIVKDFVESHGLEALIHLVKELGGGKELEGYYHLF